MANGNGWVKPILIGVAIMVVGAAIVGSTSNTINNSINQRGLEVKLDGVKENLNEQKEAVKRIPVMAEQIKDIKDDVGKILEKLDK